MFSLSLSAGLSVPQVDVPAISSCFMLSNMFDPTNETETGWERDIRDDVLDECNKFGDVLHIHVDTVSPQVGVANTLIPCAWTILLLWKGSVILSHAHTGYGLGLNVSFSNSLRMAYS